MLPIALDVGRMAVLMPGEKNVAGVGDAISFSDFWNSVKTVKSRGSKAPSPDHPLLEREDALTRVEELFRANWASRGLAMTKQHTFVVVVDCPGAGKTRFGVEIVQRIRELSPMPVTLQPQQTANRIALHETALGKPEPADGACFL